MGNHESRRLELGYLVLLNVLSFGLYSLYWFYQNWRSLEEVHGTKLRPALRTVGLMVPILDIFLIADQWKRIHDLNTHDSKSYFPLAWTVLGYLSLSYLYFTYVILAIISFTTDMPPSSGEMIGGMFIDLIAFTLLGLLLAVPQRALNAYWAQHHTGSSASRYALTPGEIAWITLGGIAWTIGAMQPFFA